MKAAIGVVIFWCIVGVVAVMLSRWKEWNAWLVFGLISIAILVNGLVATVEDQLPGGLNNPDGQNTPEYAKNFSRPSSRIIVGAFLLLLIALAAGEFLRIRA